MMWGELYGKKAKIELRKKSMENGSLYNPGIAFDRLSGISRIPDKTAEAGISGSGATDEVAGDGIYSG